MELPMKEAYEACDRLRQNPGDMPTLLLTARQTDDTQKLWGACIAENWKVERVLKRRRTLAPGSAAREPGSAGAGSRRMAA